MQMLNAAFAAKTVENQRSFLQFIATKHFAGDLSRVHFVGPIHPPGWNPFNVKQNKHTVTATD
jgi:hypothetical protein